MTISTKYNFGDKIAEQEGKVKGIHIYVSENGVQTERYFLGKDTWLTIKTKIGRRRWQR